MKRTLYLSLFIIGVILLGVGVFLYKDQKGRSANSQATAIREAQEYRPAGFCTQTITHAMHKKSGAYYTFMSSCIPPGWEAVRK